MNQQQDVVISYRNAKWSARIRCCRYFLRLAWLAIRHTSWDQRITGEVRALPKDHPLFRPQPVSVTAPAERDALVERRIRILRMVWALNFLIQAYMVYLALFPSAPPHAEAEAMPVDRHWFGAFVNGMIATLSLCMLRWVGPLLRRVPPSWRDEG